MNLFPSLKIDGAVFLLWFSTEFKNPKEKEIFSTALHFNLCSFYPVHQSSFLSCEISWIEFFNL